MKHALITGSTRGIGNEIAKALLADGIAVTGTAVSSPFPAEINDNSYFTGIHVDQNNIEAVQKVLKPVLASNAPGILINNAGVFEEAPLTGSDEEWLANWDRTMNINLRSAALLCKWFVEYHMENGSEGIIINVASRAAYRGDDPEYASYAASKAGMVGLTKTLARGLGRKGIVAYTVAPGFIETDMAAGALKGDGRERITAETAFDEVTQPGDVAEMVRWLASGKVKHASGTTFHINGASYVI